MHYFAFKKQRGGEIKIYIGKKSKKHLSITKKETHYWRQGEANQGNKLIDYLNKASVKNIDHYKFFSEITTKMCGFFFFFGNLREKYI